MPFSDNIEKKKVRKTHIFSVHRPTVYKPKFRGTQGRILNCQIMKHSNNNLTPESKILTKDCWKNEKQNENEIKQTLKDRYKAINISMNNPNTVQYL